LKYEDEKKRYRWASMPKIRQYDQVYNGRIRIVFDEKKYIRDSEKEKLEDRLGDILISLYGKAEENRVARELREEAERKRAEEERRREELRKRKEDEITRTKELTNKAEDYRIASEIRAYINAMIENGNEKATSEWIEWASKKADWYDPTLDVENEYLGRREHGKNKEEKDLDKVNVRKNYYW
jgi:phage-related minor tail protein